MHDSTYIFPRNAVCRRKNVHCVCYEYCCFLVPYQAYATRRSDTNELLSCENLSTSWPVEPPPRMFTILYLLTGYHRAKAAEVPHCVWYSLRISTVVSIDHLQGGSH